MTFLEIYEELVDRGFENVATSAGGEALLKRWINEAYREIIDYRAWAFLEAEEEGTAPLEFKDLGHVLSVVNVESQTRLTFIERAALIHFDPALASTGVGSLWYMQGTEELCVHPLDTTSTIRVRYLKVPADLKEDKDEPVIPESYQGLLVDGASVRAYKRTDNFQAGQFVRQEFDRGLRGMVKGLRISYAGNRSMVRTGTVNDYL